MRGRIPSNYPRSAFGLLLEVPSGIFQDGALLSKRGVVCKWLISREMMVLIPLKIGGIKVSKLLIINTVRTTAQISTVGTTTVQITTAKIPRP